MARWRALAHLGFEVDAIDPSAAATTLARARDDGSVARYRTAAPDDLGVPYGSADLAYYADTFEITDDLDGVLAEAERVLRPGGVLIHDTVTRTLVSRLVSRLVYLAGFQAVPATRIVPPGRYSAARLRPPEELAPALARHGLINGDVCGFKPSSGRDLVRSVLARRRADHRRRHPIGRAVPAHPRPPPRRHLPRVRAQAGLVISAGTRRPPRGPR